MVNMLQHDRINEMTFKEAAVQCCTSAACNRRSRFIGYNTVYGSRMYGTIDAPPSQCIEAPVAENLMIGMAIGMALRGLKPIVCFERHDFLLLAMDGLVNHLDKLPYMSGSQFNLPVAVRAIVGAKNPLNPGEQHTQDYSLELRSMLKHVPVFDPRSAREYIQIWEEWFQDKEKPFVMIERRDWYDLSSAPVTAAPEESTGV